MADFYIVPPRLLVGSFDRAAVVNSINTLKGDLTFTADPLSGVKIVTSGNNLQFGLITDYYVKKSGDTIFGNINFIPSGNNYGLSVAINSVDPGTGTTGAIYFNTTTNELKIYDNTGWNSIQSTSGISEAYANTRYLRLDGTNTPTANISMGTVLFRLGNLATQITAGLAGQIYFNTDSNQINLYNGSAWVPIGLGITSITVGNGLTSSQNPITTVSSISVNSAADFTWTGYHTFNQPVTFASAAQSFAINKLFISGQSEGDLITFKSGSWNRFPIGSVDYVLTVDSSGTAVTWKPTSTASGNVKNGLQYDLAYYYEAGIAVTGSTNIKYNPVTGLQIYNTTLSNNPSNGAFQVAGGIGISGNVAIGQTALFFNSSNSNYVGIKAGNTSSNFTYILPLTGPSGVGVSVLKSDATGQLSWVGISADQSGSAITSKNVETVLTDSSDSHYLIFSNSYGTSGVALSSTNGLLVSPSLDAIISGKWLGSAIATTYGGTGITTYNKGDLLVGTGDSILAKLPKGNEKYFLTSSSVFPNGIGWTTIAGVAISELAPVSPNIADLWWNDNDGSLSIYYDDGNTQQWVEILSGFTGSDSSSSGGGTGSGTVDLGLMNSIPYYPSTGTAITGSSNFLNVGTGISILYTTASTSRTTGALVVSGGVGIGGSLYVSSATGISGVTINNGIVTGSLSGTATSAQNLNVVSVGSNTSDHALLMARSLGSGVAVSSGTGLSFTPSTSTLKIGGIGISANLFTSTSTTLTLFNATSSTINAFQAGTAISVGAATGTFTINNATLRSNQSTASTSTTSGSIVALGGVGIGGSLYVGGTASSISGLIVNSSIITSGSWSATAVTSRYGGTGYTIYSTGDLLVGTGSTLTKFPIGLNNYVLITDTSQPTDLRWGLIDNSSIQNPFIGFGATTIGLGTTLNIVAGAGISFLYEGNSLTVYNRSGVLITSTYPVSPLQGDLFWHDEEGVLKVYYDDTDGPGQWVDANQRWGQGQYVTFPDLGSGDIYEVAYYSGAGHSVSGANNFTNNTSTNQVAITYTTGSASTSTGSFVVSGGVGIGGSLYAKTVVSSSGFVENVYNGGTAGTGTTIYPNWSQGSVQSYTLAGNCWLGLPTNMPTGASLTLIISQNATGGWAMTSDSNIKYAGGSKTVSTGASVIDVINMFYTGSTYLAALTTGYS